MELDKISKDVFYPCKGLLIKHSVELGGKNKRDQSKNDPFFHYSYKSSKFSNKSTLNGVKIDTSEYLILDLYEYEGDNTIALSYPHISRLKKALKKCIKWFYDDDYADIFIEKNGELIFNDKYSNETSDAYNLVRGKNIIFVPKVVEIENEQYEGCIMYCGSKDLYVQLTIDEVENFFEVLDSFNLYTASLSLLQIATNLDGGGSGQSSNGRSFSRSSDRETSEAIEAKKLKNLSRRKKPVTTTNTESEGETNND